MPARASPLVLYPSGAAAGPAIHGVSGDDGVTLNYRERARFAIVAAIRNRSQSPVTVTGVKSLDAKPKLVHLIGTIFTEYGPPPPPCRYSCPLDPVPVERDYGEALPEPVRLPPRHRLAIQFNFELEGCGGVPPGTRETVNRSVLVLYEDASGDDAAAEIALGELRVTAEAPPADACPSRERVSRPCVYRCSTKTRGSPGLSHDSRKE